MNIWFSSLLLSHFTYFALGLDLWYIPDNLDSKLPELSNHNFFQFSQKISLVQFLITNLFYYFSTISFIKMICLKFRMEKYPHLKMVYASSLTHLNLLKIFSPEIFPPKNVLTWKCFTQVPRETLIGWKEWEGWSKFKERRGHKRMKKCCIPIFFNKHWFSGIFI